MAKNRRPNAEPNLPADSGRAKTPGKETTLPATVPAELPVVCLGASAGGLEVLAQFFRKIPVETGMAYVVITHLFSSQKSYMPDLLASYTSMVVSEIKSGQRIMPNQVFVIPPGKNLSIHSDTLLLHDLDDNIPIWHPIDFFLRSLARDKKSNCICIILSGTGTDGSLGLKEIKAENGVVIAQLPETAPYDGMPRNAILTGKVDLVLTVEQMVTSLVGFSRNRRITFTEVIPPSDEAVDPLTRVLKLFLLRLGQDLALYKETTILRRISRRMVLVGVSSLEEYVELLEDDQDELETLFKDLFIDVTSFFRDQEAFAVLNAKVIPELFKNKSLKSPLRVWVVGCSSGEEAYSIAMLLREHMERTDKVCDIQIFATDISPEAIDKARSGTYPVSVSSDIDADFFSKYFEISDDYCTVTKPVREMVVFAQHDLLQDPPFLNLDFICCRNMLIYLTSEAQKNVLQIFHHALHPGGYIFLGTAETPGMLSDQYITVDSQWKLYHKKEESAENMKGMPFDTLRFRPGKYKEVRHSIPQDLDRTTLLELHLHRRYGHPAVLINSNREVLHFFGDTHRYIGPPEGPPTTNLLEILKSGLKVKIKAAIEEAGRRNLTVTIRDIRMSAFPDQRLNIIVEPLRRLPQAAGLMLIVFEAFAEGDTTVVDEMDLVELPRSDIVSQLEKELNSTRDQLQDIIEEKDLANEELSSINEELQVSNEELEASREEMQALNEELTAVNTELNFKIDELQHAYYDIDNLFVSTNLATIFVDRDLLIRRFTPAAANVFHLLSQDVGRPLGHIVSKVYYPELLDDCRTILRNGKVQEREVSSTNDAVYIARLFPYYIQEEIIEGVVLTFLDVTELKKIQVELQKHRDSLEEMVTERTRTLSERESLLSAILHNFPGGLIIILDKAHTVLFADGTGFAELNLDAAGVVGKSVTDLFSREEISAMLPYYERAFNGETVEIEIVRPQKVYILTVSPLRRPPEEKTRAIIVVARDITCQKFAEQELIKERDKARRYLDIAGVVLVALDRHGNVTMLNRKGIELLGHDSSELHGNNWLEKVVSAEDREKTINCFKQLLAGQTDGYEYFENRIITRSGERRLLAWHNSPVKDTNGTIVGTLSSGEDITERKLQEEQIRQLALFPDQNPNPVMRLNSEGMLLYANSAACTLFKINNTDKRAAVLPEELTSALKKIFKKGENHSLELFIDQMTYLFSLSPIPDYGYVNCYGMDITERKQAIHALEKELAITAALSRLYNSLISSDSTMKDIARSVSKEAALLTGSPCSFTARLDPVTLELIGHTFTEKETQTSCGIQESGKLVFAPDEEGNYPGLWGVPLKSGKPFFTNDPQNHPQSKGAPEGHFKLTSLLNVPIILGEETVGQIMVANRPGGYSQDDVHAIVRLAEHCALAFRRIRVENTAKANERLRALGEMASGIVHDINNALSPVIGYTDLLLQQKNIPAHKQDEFLNHIRTSADDIAHIITNMREFYRKREPGEVLLPIDVNTTITQVIELTRPKWKDIPQEQSRTIRVIADLEEKLPKIKCIETEFREAITNLIFNSVDAMPDGGTITIRSRIQGDDLLMEVCDTGMGMSDYVRIRCLEPLFTTKKDKGTGMGMAQVYGIVKRHGGGIEINSKSGWGTTVRLRFPLFRDEDARAIIEQKNTEEPTPVPMRVLYVDDEPALRRLLKQMLTRDGHTVLLAEDGDEGLDLVQAQKNEKTPFDVIVTDLGMPGMDGREFARKLKEISPDTPIILLSGWSQFLEMEDNADHLFHAILNKPPTLTALRKKLYAIKAKK